MRMPVMNGRQAVQAIRVVEGQLDAGSVSVIAMAADVFSQDIRSCRSCGMNAHMAKPLALRGVPRLQQKDSPFRPGYSGIEIGPPNGL